MRIKFHGPLNRVAGSCYELEEDGGPHFLVDCGLHQGGADDDALNRRPFPFDPATLDFVVLTHAHVDHCGLLPRLVREGFGGTIYATVETQELAKIALADAARMQRQEKAPLFREREVDALRWHEPTQAIFGGYRPLANDVFLRFFRTGHILGAVSAQIAWGRREAQRRITFSGDLGPCAEGEEHLPLLRFRMTPDEADFSVIESTYGGRLRPPEEQNHRARLDRLAQALREGVDRGGLTLIPCFAIGRTQDVILDLQLLALEGRLPNVPVHLHAGMARRASKVYAEHIGRTLVIESKQCAKVRPAWLGKPLFDLLELDPREPDHHRMLVDALREALDDGHAPEEPRRGRLEGWRRVWQRVDRCHPVPDGGAAIMVTGGGMCEGGPIEFYLAEHARNERTSILLTGYAPPNGIAGRLLQLGRLSLKERKFFQDPLGLHRVDLKRADVRAHTAFLLGYSAHADQAGLLSWLFPGYGKGGPVKGTSRRVFITHGETNSRRALASAIEDTAKRNGLSMTTTMPEPTDDWFDLDCG